MIHWVIGFGLLSLCVFATWLIVRRMFLTVYEEYQEDRARRTFRLQREWLEVRFLQALASRLPAERARWEDALWSDDVYWARERGSRRLLALVGIEFPASAVLGDLSGRRATALFEYRRGQWTAEGRFVDSAAPAEACRHARLEAVTPPGEDPDTD